VEQGHEDLVLSDSSPKGNICPWHALQSRLHWC
jgi:hypothetical protein